MCVLSLPLLFQNGMVLQREKPICVWGRGEEGVPVTVKLGENQVSTVPTQGTWKVYLPPMQAGTGCCMEVTQGDRSIQVEDIAIGEVWLASGQSNMEFLLRFDAEAAAATVQDLPDIRCFEVPKISYKGQENDQDYSAAGCWKRACGEESLYFTAVGYYFALRLHQKLQVPVGIINCTWGGTSASVFTAREYLTGPLERFLNEANQAQASMDYDTALEDYRQIQRQMAAAPMDMATPNQAPIFPDPGMKAAMAHMDQYRLAAFSPFRPCGLYETMLLTIAPYTLSGVIWYQGESDEPNKELYEELMTAMIHCWRDLWGETLPFLQVQLASFAYMVEPLDFVPIRETQERLCQKLPRVWLVCAMDVGLPYDVHPKHKRPIGERLALQALSKVYGFPLLADSPTAFAASRQDATVYVQIKHTGEGLHCADSTPETFDVEVDGKPITDFTVTLHQRCIAITSPAFHQAGRITVQFARRPFCADNIYNSAELPLFPFSFTV